MSISIVIIIIIIIYIAFIHIRDNNKQYKEVWFKFPAELCLIYNKPSQYLPVNT